MEKIIIIYPNISTFREKWRYFEITLKPTIFAQISENIKISRKRLVSSFLKNCFFSIQVYSKISTFRWKGCLIENIFTKYFIFPKIGKGRFFRSLRKKVSKSYFKKYQHFEEKDVILKLLWKIVVAHIYENINISKKDALLTPFWKNRFVPIFPKKSRLGLF